MISIWFRYEGREPERIDQAKNLKEANYLLGEYRMACAVLPGQHRHGRDKVWAGKKSDEPPLLA